MHQSSNKDKPIPVSQTVLTLIENFERNLDAYRTGQYNETQVRRDFIDPMVIMETAIDSDKNLKSVFDDFTGTEDEDFSFNKTVVPVKLVLYEDENWYQDHKLSAY